MSSQIRLPETAKIARAEAVLTSAFALDRLVVLHPMLGNLKKKP
jgi:hypothetical protein